MYIEDIVSGVNAKLAGEQLTFEEMVLFLDETIDLNGLFAFEFLTHFLLKFLLLFSLP